MATGTQKAYADHRGVTLRAVQKALEEGRIGPDAYDKIKAGKRWRYVIDFEKADKHWDDRTDSTFLRQPTRGQKANKPTPRRPIAEIKAERLAAQEGAAKLIGDDPIPEGEDETENPRDAANFSMIQANAAKAKVSAKMAELQYQERVGKLMDRETVFRVFSDIGTVVRDSLLNIRPRIAALLAAETDEKKCGDILDHEIRVILTALAENKLNTKLTQALDK